MLASSMGQALYFFSFSFLRERYALSPGTTSLVFSAASVCFFAGSLLSGRFVGWLGRKNAVVAGMAVFSLASLVYPNLDEVWLAAFLIVAGHLFGALQYSASISYGLEQVPGFRGSMMSISSAFSYIGYAIGAGVGGAVLLVYGWGALGLSLGALGIAGSLIYTLFTTDPTSDISA